MSFIATQNLLMARVEFHLYDINLTTLRLELSKALEGPKEQGGNEKLTLLTSELEMQASLYCKALKIDYEQRVKNHLPIIVDSKNTTYSIFLSINLVVLDVYKINSFLNYHYDTFLENYYAKDKNEFIGLVEFTIYNKLKRIAFEDEFKRREMIMQWVNEKRKLNDVSPSNYNNKEIRINEKFIVKVFEILSPFFDEAEHENLNFLLHGNPIEGHVLFLGLPHFSIHYHLQL
jgi:hypothetical protein